MSHLIVATKKSGEEFYLHITTWDSLTITLLYDSLDAQEFNGGASGNRGYKIYTPEELKKAKDKYFYIKDEPIIEETRGVEMLKQAFEIITGHYPEKTNEPPKPNFEGLDEFFSKLQGDEPLTIYFG